MGLLSQKGVMNIAMTHDPRVLSRFLVQSATHDSRLVMALLTEVHTEMYDTENTVRRNNSYIQYDLKLPIVRIRKLPINLRGRNLWH